MRKSKSPRRKSPKRKSKSPRRKSFLLRGGAPAPLLRPESPISPDLLPVFTPGLGTHLYTCSNCGKKNIRTDTMPYCQRCLDIWYTNILMVEKSENEVTELLGNINDEQEI
jgi:hypothetical protein